MKLRFYPVRTFLALATLSLGACKRPAAPAANTIPVYAAQVTQRSVPLTRTAVGLVQPLQTVALQSQVDGVIARIHFTEGDEVAAGTLLVTLDQRPFLNALNSARAGLIQARAAETRATADADRYARLHEEKAISDSDFSQYSTAAAAAKAAVVVQEASVATAQLNLDYTEIRAPIAGRTSRLAQREGSLVKANDSAQPLLILNQMAPVGVAFSVPESDLSAVRAAFSRGSVTVSAQPQGDDGKVVRGQLDYIDNTVGTTTGNIALRAKFENHDATLWPGQFVNAVIYLGEKKDAIVVPNTAIVPGQKGNQIFVIKADGAVDIRAVRTSSSDGDDVVVLDGVQPGETVVTDGQLRLLPGSRVTVKAREPQVTAVAEAQDNRS